MVQAYLLRVPHGTFFHAVLPSKSPRLQRALDRGYRAGMAGARWPTAIELTHWAFDAASQVEFRREVMHRLMQCTGSDMALFADAATPLRASHLVHMDPSEAEAARRVVLAHPLELHRANQRLLERGAMVDTNLYSAKEWERLPHIAGHQAAMGVTSNIVMWWQPRRGAPIVVNLCRTHGRYSDEQERAACAIVKALAVADGWCEAAAPASLETLPPLTERQREILDYVCRGMTNPEIARACHLSPFTVRNHLVKLFDRYQVATRTELALLVSARTTAESGDIWCRGRS